MRTGERLMPQLPMTTVVTPCDILHSMHSGPHSTARSSCVCASMKPGAIALPVATTSRSALAAPRSPTAVMRSPVTPTSAFKRALPVPSNTVASRMIRSQRSAIRSASQLYGRGRIEFAIRCDGNFVELARGLCRNQAVAHIACHRCGIPLQRITHAAAAGQFEDQPIAFGDHLKAFGAQCLAGLQRDYT